MLERWIVPGLGVVILLSTFILHVPIVYKLMLGLLGLAAIGTYFAPHNVQVETRIGIAAVGLIILLIVTSTAFWLILLSFGAIAALQFQHRDSLQRNVATFAWLGTVIADIQARRSDGGEGEARIQAQLPGFIRLNVAGIGGVVTGALVLVSVFMPWYGFLISAFGELSGGLNLTLQAGAAELELPALRVFFFLLMALGLAGMVSIVLPRVVALFIAIAGFLVTLVSYLYVLGMVSNESAELSSLGVGATTIPAMGAWLAALSFLALLVLQLVPAANRSR